MNNIILAGCMLTYSSVFLLGLDGRLVTEQVFPLVCSVRQTLHLWRICCRRFLVQYAVRPQQIDAVELVARQ